MNIEQNISSAPAEAEQNTTSLTNEAEWLINEVFRGVKSDTVIVVISRDHADQLTKTIEDLTKEIDRQTEDINNLKKEVEKLKTQSLPLAEKLGRVATGSGSVMLALQDIEQSA